MPLQKSLLPLAFAQGLNTKSDPKQLQPGALLELENGVFTKFGEINKRYGYDILGKTIEGSTDTIGAGVALSSFNSELTMFDGYKIYSHLTSTGNWIDRGIAISVIEDNQQIVRLSDSQQLSPDCAVLNGVEVYAWEDSRGGVRYSVLDSDTKTFIVSDQLIDIGASRPKLISFANNICIFYVVSQELNYLTVNTSNPTILTDPINLISDGYAIDNVAYDAAAIGSKLCVSYLSHSTSSGAINLFYLDTGFNLSSITHVETTAGKAINTGYQGAINVVGDSQNNIWISWAEGIHVRTAAYSNNLTSLLSDTIVDTCACVALAGIEDDPEVLHLFYEVFNANVMNEQTKHRTIDLTGTLGTANTIRSVGLASKPAKFNDIITINVAFESDLQSTYFTITSGHSIIAKISSSNGGGLINNNMVPEIVQTSSGVFVFANLIRGKIISEANTIYSLLGVNSTQVEFTPTNRFISAISGNNLFIVGGILQSYDGVSVVEHGYHLYPESVTAVPTGSDGYLSAGQYQYTVTYEWTDNRGQVQISATSVPTTITVSANNHVTLTIPTLRLTAKTGNRSDCRIVIYRTSANGIDFNQVTSNDAPLMNDTTVDTVQFVDILSDNDIAADALVYTTGGTLDNDGPPACSIIQSYRGRIFLAGLEDKNQIWFSKNKFDNSNSNTIPVEFSDVLTIGCDQRGGSITALGLLDDKLVIFKETSIFIVVGDGPTDTGANSDYNIPEMISSDVGCINANSVVVMPNGIMFESDKGIYLLGRDISLNYIGAPVEDFNSYNITSATLEPDANLVVFTTDIGPALVYNYFFNQWGDWTNHQAQDSDVFNNNLALIKSDGSVYIQNKSKFTDGSLPVYLKWTTANCSFAGVQGFQRVYKAFILGTYKGAHSLIVSVAYDNNNSYTEQTTINAAEIVGQNNWGGDDFWGGNEDGYDVWGGEYVPYQFRLDLATQKCTSIRISVQETQSGSYNEGYSVSNIAFEVGQLPGAIRIPVSRTFGVK